jgi:hypothetical protein
LTVRLERRLRNGAGAVGKRAVEGKGSWHRCSGWRPGSGAVAYRWCCPERDLLHRSEEGEVAGRFEGLGRRSGRRAR